MTVDTMNRTPLYQFHVDRGAKLVEFAGWEMPMLYTSIIEEHRQVRTSGGLFDVSHMGRVRFTGTDACRFVDLVCSRKIEDMADGRCRYSLVCNDRGGCRDDVLVYRLGADEYVMVCNASNRAKLIEHFDDVRGSHEVTVRDETIETAMIALQGPKVIELIGAVAPEVVGLKRFQFVRKDIMGADVMVSRTGYTGEDGVEVIMPAALAMQAVSLLGTDESLKPAGLGARDTLRLEAAMALYGHEITETIDPLSAGLDFAVSLDKDFIGRDALKGIEAKGPHRTLRGLVLEGRRTARQGMAVTAGGRELGVVTSGCLSPTLGKPIAMAYIEAAHDGDVELAIGGGVVAATVVPLPFYKR